MKYLGNTYIHYIYITILLIITSGCSVLQTKPLSPSTHVFSSTPATHTQVISPIALCKNSQRYIQKQSETQDNKCIHVGYGVTIDTTGYILSAAHVLADNERSLYAHIGQTTYPLKNIWIHPHEDLALARIAYTGTSATIHSTTFPTTGFITSTVTGNIMFVSGSLIHTTILLTGGLSGSPLFSHNYSLVGIAKAYDPTNNIGLFTAVTDTHIIQRIRDTLLHASQQSP